MHIHFLGISGTFMSGLAILAREAGFEVSGCDAHCYPPISDLLDAKGVQWIEGYEVSKAFLKADLVVVGNAMKRGMPIVEAMLNMKKPYTSGPEWLREAILKKYRVIAISGTHGKTTTTCMVASILEAGGLKPGFLIGGVSPAFKTNARLGEGEWFVIEADEYDTAFFDKRPKLMHYRPEVAILNNLEFDHADIYPHLEAIEQQFHYYLRTIKGEGIILSPAQDEALNRVLKKGLYSRHESMGVGHSATWHAELLDKGASAFKLHYEKACLGEIHWPLIGQFNVENALSAFAATYHAGVKPEVIVEALASFQPVKRRLELRGEKKGVAVYDDFAHHPTAIQKTLTALKQSARHKRILVALEFASYTMKTGVHTDKMQEVLAMADQIYILKPSDFDIRPIVQAYSVPVTVCDTTDDLVKSLCSTAKAGDAILVMSNRGFENVHQRLIDNLFS